MLWEFNSVKDSHREEGITVDMGKILNPIKKRKWENFVKHPEPIVVSVVREFYANAIEHKDYRVFV